MGQYNNMESGTKEELLNVDSKGRLHLPKYIRKSIGIKNQVIVKIEDHNLIIKPIDEIEDPIEFLSSIKFKTKKTPIEMKREAESAFT